TLRRVLTLAGGILFTVTSYDLVRHRLVETIAHLANKLRGHTADIRDHGICHIRPLFQSDLNSGALVRIGTVEAVGSVGTQGCFERVGTSTLFDRGRYR